ncbi:MAG: ParA family protein, partial [Caulobacteraceae bacterium]|nr:ParA family protein [Caulobacteraceae bacterium]
PKGGVGKTTSAVLLGGVLADMGAPVTMIDADPNQPVSSWAKLAGRPENLRVIRDVTQDTVIDVIEEEAQRSTFVICDLEGTASLTVSYAVSRSDLVLIPLQGSHLDAAQAARAVKLVRSTEKAIGRSVPFALFFNRVSTAIQPRTFRHIRDEFESASLPVLACTLQEREAFRAIFSFGGTVGGLTSAQASNLPAALANVSDFARAVTNRLRPTAATAQEA